MRRYLLLVGAVALLLLLAGGMGPSAQAAPEQQPGGNWAIPGGRFFTETAPPGYGFRVIDDGQARFWTEFNRLGGLQNVGYPISQRFVYDGFTTQAFQKLVLQWRPEVNQAWPVNVFDELSRHGYDDHLFVYRQTPFPLRNFDPPGATWAQIIANRQALLNTHPAIRARYFSVGDPLTVFGLPVSRVEDMGNHFAIRTQRAVFQQWKVAVPWAAPGQVTIANGGDIAKELGWLPAAAVMPEPVPGTPSPTPIPSPTPGPAVRIDRLLVGGGSPQRLYAMVSDVSGLVAGLRISTDGGRTWTTYSGGLPAQVRDMTVVPGDIDTMTTVGYSGIHRWQNGGWQRLSTFAGQAIATSFADPNRMWVAQDTWHFEAFNVFYTTDGGQTWSIVAPGFAGSALSRVGEMLVDPRNNATIFATATNHYGHGTYNRFMPGNTQWYQPTMPGGIAGIAELAFDPRAGSLYAGNGLSGVIYRNDNPAAPPQEVQWLPVAQGPDRIYRVLAIGHDATHSILYATVSAPAGGTAYSLQRSVDGGTTWEALTNPTP